jgi:hypothetical protein
MSPRRRQLQVHLLEGRGLEGHLLAEFRQRAQESKLAPHHDPHAIGHLLGHRQRVRRHEHGHALAGTGRQQVLDDTHAARIQAHHRLVEHEHVGVVKQGSGEHEPLLHSQRVPLGEFIGELAQFEVLDLAVDPRAGEVTRHPEHVGDEPEELAARQLVVEAGFVGHVADVQVRGPRVDDEVVATNADGAP